MSRIENCFKRVREWAWMARRRKHVYHIYVWPCSFSLLHGGERNVECVCKSETERWWASERDGISTRKGQKTDLLNIDHFPRAPFWVSFEENSDLASSNSVVFQFSSRNLRSHSLVLVIVKGVSCASVHFRLFKVPYPKIFHLYTLLSQVHSDFLVVLRCYRFFSSLLIVTNFELIKALSRDKEQKRMMYGISCGMNYSSIVYYRLSLKEKWNGWIVRLCQ